MLEFFAGLDPRSRGFASSPAAANVEAAAAMMADVDYRSATA